MARRPSKHLRTPRPLSPSLGRGEARRDGVWVVQNIPAGRSVKDYTCPGCHRPVVAGAPHVVAWPQAPRIGATSAVDDRRHWHTPCWARRH